MHEALFDYLKKFSSEPLSEEEKALLRKAYIPSRLRKRQFLLQAGDQFKNMAFIVKGSMRMFSVDDKGAEHIVRLGVEGWWMGDRESWSMQTPSRYYIDAWENTDILSVSRDNHHELMKQIPIYCEMIRQLDERNQIASTNRVNLSLSADAEKRYTEFITCYRELYNRFPQHIIASYIGVNKDTLSRIKRQRVQR